MAELIRKIPSIITDLKQNQHNDKHNESIFDILEGDVLKYVTAQLRNQLTYKSFSVIEGRIAPVNVLRRVIQKLSQIYSEPPVRDSENQTDLELINYYSELLDINAHMNDANEFFNAFKSVAIEPYIGKNGPSLRVLAPTQFYAYGDNPTDRMDMTVFIKKMGKMQNVDGSTKNIYFSYTDDEFVPFDEDGNIVSQYLVDNPQMVNPYGKIPFVYVNRSRHRLVPTPAIDDLRMATLIPILLSDINYSVMFQAFSIIYGIDLDTANLEMAPNAIWNFKSDSTSQNKPELGSIKPSIDISEVLELIKGEYAMWLESKNVRPGSAGQATGENFASGISQMVQNADTTEDKKAQIVHFLRAERDLWDLIAVHMHPIWTRMGVVDDRRQFSPDFQPSIRFQDPVPFKTDEERIKNQTDLLSNGLTSKRRALLALNPNYSDDQIDELLAEIDEEKTITIVEDNSDNMNHDEENNAPTEG